MPSTAPTPRNPARPPRRAGDPAEQGRASLALRLALVALVAVVLSPLVGSAAAVLRYVTHVQPGTAWVGACVLACGCAALAVWRGRWSGARWRDAGALASLAAGAAWLVRRAMALPGFDDLPTIGGGDAGNHVAIAAAWATDLPRAYLGFTGQHALLWAVDHGLRDDLIHSLSDVHRLGLWTGLTLSGWVAWALLRPALDAARPLTVGLALASAAGVATLAWPDIAGLLAHYLQVEGFFPHAFAIAPLALLAWALVLPLPWPRRLGALVVAVVALRFTYGLQLGDALLGVAGVLTLETLVAARQRGAAPTEDPRPTRLATSLRVGLHLAGAAVCASGAAVALWTLWGRRHKTGGVQPFDPSDLRLALALLLLAPVLLGVVSWLRGRRPTSAQGPNRQAHTTPAGRLAVFAALFCAPSLALTTASASWASRGYYVTKYPLTPLMWLALLAPAAAVGVVVALRRREPLPPARRVAALAVVTVVTLAAVLFGSHHARTALIHANPYVAATWRERVDPTRPMRTLRPLADRHLLAYIDRDVTRRGRTLAALVHDKWPVYNVALSVARGWRSPGFDRVPDLQSRRFPAFQRGAEPSPGTCVVWTETPARLQEVRRRAQRQGSPIAGRVSRWRRNPARRCQRYVPHWAAAVRARLAGHHKHDGHGHSHVAPHLPMLEEVCVLCQPPTGADANADAPAPL